MKSSLQRTFGRIGHNWGLYLLLLPSLILLIIFSYKPMYGVIIAFKDYKNSLGIVGSPWADPLFKHFIRFFNSFQCGTTIKNTLALSLYSMLVGFPIPIILALMINQITAKRFRKGFQTVLYLPHFISTVVMVGLLLIWLSPSRGLLGAIFSLFGKTAPNIMGNASAFRSIYVWSDVWQHAGWDSIVFLAALSSIDPTLYEAAVVDGASRWQKQIYIDLPLLLPTACIMLILRAGGIMNVGFEKVFLMQNSLNQTTSEVIAISLKRNAVWTHIEFDWEKGIISIKTEGNRSFLPKKRTWHIEIVGIKASQVSKEDTSLCCTYNQERNALCFSIEMFRENEEMTLSISELKLSQDNWLMRAAQRLQMAQTENDEKEMIWNLLNKKGRAPSVLGTIRATCSSSALVDCLAEVLFAQDEKEGEKK